MFTIIQANENEIICTLTERQTLNNPHFLFIFRNEQSKIIAACIAEDSSEFTERYNKFIIIEKTSPDNLNGEVRLKDTGFYDYDIYEQNSAANLDPALADNFLETGKMKVLQSLPAVNSFTDSQTVTVYKG